MCQKRFATRRAARRAGEPRRPRHLGELWVRLELHRRPARRPADRRHRGPSGTPAPRSGAYQQHRRLARRGARLAGLRERERWRDVATVGPPIDPTVTTTGMGIASGDPSRVYVSGTRGYGTAATASLFVLSGGDTGAGLGRASGAAVQSVYGFRRARCCAFRRRQSPVSAHRNHRFRVIAIGAKRRLSLRSLWSWVAGFVAQRVGPRRGAFNPSSIPPWSCVARAPRGRPCGRRAGRGRRWRRRRWGLRGTRASGRV